MLVSLPRPQRAVVVCRVPLQLSTAETAAALDTTEGTVKSRLARALTGPAHDHGPRQQHGGPMIDDIPRDLVTMVDEAVRALPPTPAELRRITRAGDFRRRRRAALMIVAVAGVLAAASTVVPSWSTASPMSPTSPRPSAPPQPEAPTCPGRGPSAC